MNPYSRIKAGIRVEVNPYRVSQGSKTHADTPGIVIKRKGGAIHFEPDTNVSHLLDSQAEQWSSVDPWTYRINVLDITTVEGVPIEQWLGANVPVIHDDWIRAAAEGKLGRKAP